MSYTVKVDEIQFSKIKEYYSSYFVNNDGEYVDFSANKDGVIITGYLSSKQTKKITFTGDNAFNEASIWDSTLTEDDTNTKNSKVVDEHWLDFQDQIGSDEVGVGDFLLPIVVVAAYVPNKNIKSIIKLGVHDSKKLTDQKILEIVPKLLPLVDYSKLTIDNNTYNKVIGDGENLNSIKAKMHNRALLNMHKKYPDVFAIYVDQFVEEKTYYRYLNDAKEEKVLGISFKTKGESYFPCVAVASVIARYSFLKKKEKLEKKYKLDIPFGASKKVDDFVQLFIDKYGFEELNKIAKKNFANYKKLLSEKLV